MQRVNTATAVAQKPAYATGGTPGFFFNGDPVQSLPPTMPGQDFFNRVQEEICNVILASGRALDGADDTQLLDSIMDIIAENAPAPAAATEEAAGIARIATTEEVAAGTDDATFVTPAKLAARLGSSALDEAYIDAGAMTESAVNGATSVTQPSPSNSLTGQVMSYQGAVADTSAEFAFRLPGNWDLGTVKAKVLWEPAAGASAGDLVRFTLAAVAVGNDDPLDVALGAAVNLDDTVLAAGDLHISSASAALTIGGTPQAGDYLRFKLSRDYDYGSPHLDEAALVRGIVFQVGLSGSIAAW